MNELANLAQSLNYGCFCATLDRRKLKAAFATEAENDQVADLLLHDRPLLFSSVSVFLSDQTFEQMQRAVQAIEGVMALPAYFDAIQLWTPGIAQTDHGPAGAFMGYDFHLGDDGPKLIEINTNAGGAMLNAILARAQGACCGIDAASRAGFPGAGFETAVVRMFREEWHLQRGSAGLGRIAIVDEYPQSQYLYPEFLLIQALLKRHGIEAIVIDPSQLCYAERKLMYGGELIDLVYNRLVDFSLTLPQNTALRQAYDNGDAVLTPNPHIHARFADKRNLTVLADPERLVTLGVSPTETELLKATVPATLIVTPENAAELWAERRDFFFKPATGYGSKAAYRGAKLTKSVWADIVKGCYVAQAYAPPSERMVKIDGGIEPRKVDVRLYTYRGEVLLTAARLYKGQTTNFRTEGGGFAPVLRTSQPEVCPA